MWCVRCVWSLWSEQSVWRGTWAVVSTALSSTPSSGAAMVEPCESLNLFHRSTTAHNMEPAIPEPSTPPPHIIKRSRAVAMAALQAIAAEGAWSRLEAVLHSAVWDPFPALAVAAAAGGVVIGSRAVIGEQVAWCNGVETRIPGDGDADPDTHTFCVASISKTILVVLVLQVSGLPQRCRPPRA